MNSYGVKIVLVGNSGVGKSQLSSRFTKKQFKMDSQSTVGMEFSTSKLEFEKCTVKAQLWDTAGQERFEGMTKRFYKDALGAAVVFDVSSKQSYDDVRNIWLPQIRNYAHPNIKIILVGNKLDLLPGKEREVSIDEARIFAQKENLDYLETSAATGYCVEPLFRRLALCIASQLPDIKNNLELSDLPEGWMAVVVDESESPLHQNNNNVNNHGANGDPSSGATASMSSNSCGSSASSSGSPTPRLLRGNSQSYKDTIMKRPSMSLSMSPHNSTNTTQSKCMRVEYVNYWTGESTDVLPVDAAPTGLLFTAVSISKSERDKENELDFEKEYSRGSRLTDATARDSDMFSIRSSRARSTSFSADKSQTSQQLAAELNVRDAELHKYKVRKCSCIVL